MGCSPPEVKIPTTTRDTPILVNGGILIRGQPYRSFIFARLARRPTVQRLRLELPPLEEEDAEPFDSDEDGKLPRLAGAWLIRGLATRGERPAAAAGRFALLLHGL